MKQLVKGLDLFAETSNEPEAQGVDHPPVFDQPETKEDTVPAQADSCLRLGAPAIRESLNMCISARREHCVLPSPPALCFADEFRQE